MEHLSLEIFDLDGTGSSYAALPEDCTVTVTDTSEIFASGDVWSLPFTLNVHANAHIFGSAGDMRGSRLHDQLHRRRARLWAEGVPMYLGHLLLPDEADVDDDGNVNVTLEAGRKTFDEMIEGAKANQVPMMGDVQIGMALWRKRWTSITVKLLASVTVDIDGFKAVFSGDVTHGGSDKFTFEVDGSKEGSYIQQYPRMVFPDGVFTDWHHVKPDEDASHINTDQPYNEDGNGTPVNPYCNVALCYQKSGYTKRNADGTTYDDYSNEPEAQRGYEYMPADRVNSAPNFFVIYWLRALMKHLGIHIEENQMMGVEDLRRLFFVNTDCAYEEPKDLKGDNATRYGKYVSGAGRLVAEYIDPRKTVRIDESGFKGTNVSLTPGSNAGSGMDLTDKVSVKIREVMEWNESQKNKYISENKFFHKAFATSDCFPDADISEVIDALRSGFGIRLLFSGDYRRVRIVLLRNVFRSGDVQDISCDINSDSKTESCIRGFRMTYGDSTDTQFYYKGFDDKLPHKKPYFADNSDKHDYSHWDLCAEYGDLINRVTAFDKTCSVTPVNGNAYGIKVDKDAKRYDELHPSMFEFAGYMDAEDGDCTGEDETVETVSVGFAPAVMNDLNMDEEREPVNSRKQRFALFVDEEMRPRRPDLNDGKDYNDPKAVYDVDELYRQHGPGSSDKMTGGDGIVKPGEFAITSDMYAAYKGAHADLSFIIGGKMKIDFDIEGHINEGYRLYLQDNYEPNDDGVCPIENHDWGLTLGIMRGSGSDATVDYKADPDDGEGNDTWDIVAGSSVTAHPDTCDCYGELWDYDGTTKVDGAASAMSALGRLFQNSNCLFYIEGYDKGYVTGFSLPSIPDNDGVEHRFLIATRRGSYRIDFGQDYIHSLYGRTVAEIMAIDAAREPDRRIIIEADSSNERGETMLKLCRIAYGNSSETIILDNDGVGTTLGRFSLKLRAEKLNPYYNPDSDDPEKKRQYLEITNENLRGRGLMDQFYKEYSYWVRNARIANMKVTMELAQLLAIDKTKRVRIGDITGFIKKMEYSVSNRTGLGQVKMEIMYI